MIRVERPFVSRTGASAGQSIRGVAAWPGVLEYRHRTLMPNPTEATHRATAATVTAGFLKLVRNDISNLNLLIGSEFTIE
jgi:hypothetical protein